MEKLEVIVFNTQPPHLYFGGVERRIIETGKRLRDKVDFRVFSGTKAGFRKPVNYKGIKLFPCRSSDLIFPLDNWTFNRSISKIAKSAKADVFEAHNVSGYGFQKALKKRRKKNPFITTVHGVLADEYAQNLAIGNVSVRSRLSNLFMEQLARVERNSANDSTLVVTISEYSKKKITELYGVDASKIRIVPNGVDVEKFKPMDKRPNLSKYLGIEGKEVVLFVGRLIPRKGLNYLIDAAKTVIKQRNETLFVIAGDGPLKGTLMNDVRRANLGMNIVFLGDVSEEELPMFYGCSDVFVLPSVQEGQGIVLLEAQASGKPVVAFNLSGVAETVLNKETGLLVEPNSNMLAEAILKLLENESTRIRMGEKGRDYILNNFTWDMCARKMLEVYCEARFF